MQSLKTVVKSLFFVVVGAVLARHGEKMWYRVELALPDTLNPMLTRTNTPFYDSDDEELCALANERRRAWLHAKLAE